MPGKDLIFAIGQISYADLQRSNKWNKVKQNRQRIGVNNVDSDFVVLNTDLKKHLPGTIPGR